MPPHHPQSRTLRADSTVNLLLFAGLVIALPILPAEIGMDLPSRGGTTALGYRTDVAYFLVLVTTVLAIVTSALLTRSEEIAAADVEKPTKSQLHLFELGAVALMVGVLYFPFFLARYGPYLEDGYFLTVLQRMLVGQHPYSDFETQYGPLMLMPVRLWVSVFGYSMTAYYSYLAVLEVLQYVLLLAVLQYWIPERNPRLLIFMTFAILLFNDNLGISWNGLRRLTPVLILMLFARYSTSRGVLTLVAALLGLLTAYSPEYGAAGLLAVIATLAIHGFREDRGKNFLRAVFVAGASVTTWLICTTLILGNRFTDYVQATVRVVGQRSGGEAGFPFSWNLNSLAVFALLMISALVLGRGLRLMLGGETLLVGDTFFLSGFTYALVAFKSGLARSDMYHLSAPALALMFPLLLPMARGVFKMNRNVRRAGALLVGTIAVTYALGLAGIGAAYAKGWLQGATDLAFGRPAERQAVVAMRGPSILFEQSHPDSDLIELAEYLASPEQSQRAVVYYGSVWGLDKMIGVPKVTFPTDDYLMTDADGEEIGRFLDQDSNAVVLIHESEHEQLMGGPPANPYGSFLFAGRPLGRVLFRLSSSHYGPAVREELLKKQNRWARTVGEVVRRSFSAQQQFGSILLLERDEDQELPSQPIESSSIISGS